jgi:hypothetical protein
MLHFALLHAQASIWFESLTLVTSYTNRQSCLFDRFFRPMSTHIFCHILAIGPPPGFPG